ncbi:uncharacterized protein LOC135804841 isoform X2 [Sycon ciliatum]|uniref:uncharacterized protein LOC135804841 isoform X2 n=1 Tax=Sycon ciliatum TaxID=27933 RepID=UPI0031F712F9
MDEHPSPGSDENAGQNAVPRRKLAKVVRPTDHQGLGMIDEDAELIIEDESELDTPMPMSSSSDNASGHDPSDSLRTESTDKASAPPSSLGSPTGGCNEDSSELGMLDLSAVCERLEALQTARESTSEASQVPDGNAAEIAAMAVVDEDEAVESSELEASVGSLGSWSDSDDDTLLALVRKNVVVTPEGYDQALLDVMSVMSDTNVPSLLQYRRETQEINEVVPPPEPIEKRFNFVYDEKLKCYILPPVKNKANLTCDFCGQLQFGPKELVANRPVVRGQKLPAPSTEEIDQLQGRGEYCCQQYFHMCKVMLLRWMDENEKASKLAPVLIDIAPSSHYGSKEARKAAKRRMIDKLIMREHMRKGKTGPVSFYALKKGKTVSFSLAGQARSPKGWVMADADPEKKAARSDRRRSYSDTLGGSLLILPSLKHEDQDQQENPRRKASAQPAPETASELPVLPSIHAPTLTSVAQGMVPTASARQKSAVKRKLGVATGVDQPHDLGARAMAKLPTIERDGQVRTSPVSVASVDPSVDSRESERRTNPLCQVDTSTEATPSMLSLVSTQSERMRRNTTSAIPSQNVLGLEHSRHLSLALPPSEPIALPRLPKNRLVAAASGAVAPLSLLTDMLHGKLSRDYPKPFIRHYNSGELFAARFSDGTSCCFYPNGSIAVYTSFSKDGGMSTYAYEPCLSGQCDDPTMLAMFCPSIFHGCCYTPSGSIRVLLDRTGGVVFDQANQGRQRRWSWLLPRHVSPMSHAPAFQPICLALSNHVSLRCVRHNNIVIIFSHGAFSMRFPITFDIPQGTGKESPGMGVHGDLKDTKTKITSLLRKMNTIENYGGTARRWAEPESKAKTPFRPTASTATAAPQEDPAGAAGSRPAPTADSAARSGNRDQLDKQLAHGQHGFATVTVSKGRKRTAPGKLQKKQVW